LDLGSWIWPVALSPIIGSFLGVLVLRAESPRSIVFGRSACALCDHPLEARDLLPVLSWVAAHGRCRYCGRRIGAFYPGIEIAALAVAVWSAIVFSGSLVWASCLLGWFLLALAATDFKFYLLPDFLTVPLIAAGLLVTTAIDPSAVLAHAAGAVSGFSFVVVLRYAYWKLRGREGMGLGDAKLLCAAGAWVAWDGLPSVVLIAALSALCFLLLKSLRGGTISLGDRIPFGVFLCLGTWIVWLYGPLVLG
jgi:leader peptidase (prepilin peptidase)/N-methyltransferase